MQKAPATPPAESSSGAVRRRVQRTTTLFSAETPPCRRFHKTLPESRLECTVGAARTAEKRSGRGKRTLRLAADVLGARGVQTAQKGGSRARCAAAKGFGFKLTFGKQPEKALPRGTQSCKTDGRRSGTSIPSRRSNATPFHAKATLSQGPRLPPRAPSLL